MAGLSGFFGESGLSGLMLMIEHCQFDNQMPKPNAYSEYIEVVIKKIKLG